MTDKDNTPAGERERAEFEVGIEWIMDFNIKNGRQPTRREVWEAARREERKRIQDDPGSQLFGRSLTEIRRALNFYDTHKRLEER